MLTGCLGRAGNHSISQLPCSSRQLWKNCLASLPVSNEMLTQSE